MGKDLVGKGISKQLREFGLKNYPGTHLKSPWPGHLDLAVKDKTYAYLSPDDDDFGISCKLPQSCAAALMFDFTEPTPYGLGKSGWVSAKFTVKDKIPPVELFKAWIDESYRAQAPKTFVKQLTHAPGSLPSGAPVASAPAQKAPAKKASAPAKKTSAKKAPAKKTRARR